MSNSTSTPLSLLIVLPWSPNLPGGVSVVVRNLVQQWRSESLIASVMVSDWGATQPVSDHEGTLNFRFALLGSLHLAGLVKALLSAPIRLWRTWYLLHIREVSAVNFHYPSLDAIGVAVLKRLGLFRGRLVLSFHGTDVRVPSTALEQRLWRWLLGVADGVTACSGALAKEVVQTYGVALARVTIVYNGTNTKLFAPLLSNDLVSEQVRLNLYIVSVGGYIPLKGHRILLDAFALVAPSFPSLGLVIAGMDGPERMPLLARSKELGVLDRVTLLVNLKPAEVAELMARAALALQPSFAESFGMAVIEAGACGVPVAASAVGGHLELVQDHETGYLFEAGDVEGCAAVITEILVDKDAAKKVAENFRAAILRRYTWPACAHAYLKLMIG